MSYQGADTIRPHDNGGLCGGGAFETKGCAENDCSASSVNTGGSDGIGSNQVTIENVRVNDFHRSEDEGKIGAPDPKVDEAVAREHTASKDSKSEFVTGNYGVTTTSDTEWRFVTAPESQQEWPVEARLAEAPGKQRKPLPLADLRKSLEAQNARLKSLGEPPLGEIEAVGGRLYTCAPCPVSVLEALPHSIACRRGPMFVKYNGVLRAWGSEPRGLKIKCLYYVHSIFTLSGCHGGAHILFIFVFIPVTAALWLIGSLFI